MKEFVDSAAATLGGFAAAKKDLVIKAVERGADFERGVCFGHTYKITAEAVVKKGVQTLKKSEID